MEEEKSILQMHSEISEQIVRELIKTRPDIISHGGRAEVTIELNQEKSIGNDNNVLVRFVA
jgi:hypothetical protein